MSKEVKQLAKAAKARKPDWYVMDGHDWFLPSETMEFMASVTPDFVIALLAERDGLAKAAQRVLDGLNARIDEAVMLGGPLPVFEGIADLHDALQGEQP